MKKLVIFSLIFGNLGFAMQSGTSAQAAQVSSKEVFLKNPFVCGFMEKMQEFSTALNTLHSAKNAGPEECLNNLMQVKGVFDRLIVLEAEVTKRHKATPEQYTSIFSLVNALSMLARQLMIHFLQSVPGPVEEVVLTGIDGVLVKHNTYSRYGETLREELSFLHSVHVGPFFTSAVARYTISAESVYLDLVAHCAYALHGISYHLDELVRVAHAPNVGLRDTSVFRMLCDTIVKYDGAVKKCCEFLASCEEPWVQEVAQQMRALHTALSAEYAQARKDVASALQTIVTQALESLPKEPATDFAHEEYESYCMVLYLGACQDVYNCIKSARDCACSHGFTLHTSEVSRHVGMRAFTYLKKIIEAAAFQLSQREVTLPSLTKIQRVFGTIRPFISSTLLITQETREKLLKIIRLADEQTNIAYAQRTLSLMVVPAAAATVPSSSAAAAGDTEERLLPPAKRVARMSS